MQRYLPFYFVFLSCLFSMTSEAQDLNLWYDHPAEEWVEALPIGNGRLGAMVFGAPGEDRIQFNEETLWTGYPRDYNRKGASRFLDSIRNLLFEGKQNEAEKLAGEEFMGVKSESGDMDQWENGVLNILRTEDNPSRPDFDDTAWNTIRVPEYDGWEVLGHEGMDGAVWFRYTFDLPEEYTDRELFLDLNKIADKDITFLNGRQVGSRDDDKARVYKIPSDLLKKRRNTIAVLVLNYQKKGGILGFKDRTREIGLRVSKDSELVRSLNGDWKYFIQDDDVPAVGQYQASYQPFGDLYLYSDVDTSEIRNYKRNLDLRTATLTTEYEYNNVHFTRTYIASVPDSVIAVHSTADRPGKIDFIAELSSPHKAFEVLKKGERSLALKVKVRYGALHGDAEMRIETKGGTVAVEENRLIVKKADEATIFLTAATNYKSYDGVSGDPARRCEKILNLTSGKSFQDLLASHRTEYRKYFDTFSISFPDTTASEETAKDLPTDIRLQNFRNSYDPQFMALYVQYGRYLLISSSRPGTYPANLQGIWNDLLDPPWNSKYTTNINLEMNYWPAEVLNLSPMHSALFKLIEEVAERGKETAKEYYDARGWVLHHNTDLWRGTAPINASNHGIWVTGGAWLCDHLWEHYRFTRSKDFLRDTAYPIMKSASEFFDDFLIEDPKTGYLISTPSNSPEQGGLVAGPAMDHQIIRALFKNTIKAAEILEVDATLREELTAKYSRIAPDHIGRHGQLQEWMEDVDDPQNKHRHVSHLWAVHPGDEINWDDSPELMKAARQSLIFRGDEATGWSLGWKINLWARFRDGDRAYRLTQLLLSPAVRGAGSYPNLFDAHPPFQIDGNFGGAAGIAEMLVQSHTPYIDILPALPSVLGAGRVAGIRVRGGFVVSMKWSGNELDEIEVESKAGMPLMMRYKEQIVRIETEKDGLYRWDGQFKRL